MMTYFSHLFLLTLVSTAGSQVTHFDHYGDEVESVPDEYSAPDVPPIFISKGQHFTVDVGGKITFPCQVENQGAYMLMFRHIMPSGDHRTLYVGDMALRQTKRLSKSGNSFSLSGVRRSHAGQYVCRIETSPAIEVTHTLDVQYPATVRRVSPALQHVVQGSSVTLECRADGNPQATITWSRQQGHLPSGQRRQQGQKIILDNADRDVEGTYICTASNGLGAPSSATMTVEIQYPPEIIAEETVLHTGEGHFAELVCRVHGRPTPTVSWSKGGRPVSPDRHVSTHDSLHRHTLTISKVTEDDFGEYTCTAESSLGRTNSSLRLTGLPRIPRVTSSPAGGEMTSYMLTWEAESHTPVIMYRLQHRRQKDGQTINSQSVGNWNIRLYSPKSLSVPFLSSLASPRAHTTSGPVQYMSHAIEDLEPATDYEATVAVENKFGWSGDSEVFHFYTRKEEPSTTTGAPSTLPPRSKISPITKEVAVGQSVSGCACLCQSLSLLPLILVLAALL